jgi:hypothetical protein
MLIWAFTVKHIIINSLEVSSAMVLFTDPLQKGVHERLSVALIIKQECGANYVDLC